MRLYIRSLIMYSVLDCQFFRRFGVEIELNTLNGIVKVLDKKKKEIPNGADHIAHMVNMAVGENVEIQPHGYNSNNSMWVVKPDSSCGIEVCTPVLKGWSGLKRLISVIEAFNDANVSADNRCSFHVHVNIKDLNMIQLASVISWYIKCEHVFMDSVPSRRKNSRYCQSIGMTDLFYDSFSIEPDMILRRVSNVKYYSLNAYHFLRGGGFSDQNDRKKTIEFRIGENDLCLDAFAAKNWVRLLLHFVEVTKDRGLPNQYSKGDPWSGLLWLEPQDVFKVLKFDQPCSDGLNQVKMWFIDRILKNGYDTGLHGIWSNEGRSAARSNFLEMINGIELETHESREELLYGEKYIK